ncbi:MULTISPECIES: helix-turn-helix domain-containing protein [Pelosinus]|uniref:BetR domain protein n=1 Tax=Pelosinus fermentans B4 TaxID=1149862 RepID=I9LHH7_9FIRM|nr:MULTISPECIES: helix-turn-helix domain-containing protein [Pelosinus]EIW19964.1 BetR domain protein [Pelosinus fermentans B4]EIW21179.1 hypothetical protein FA11_0906 [Pelosinus fermentans A11]
MDSQALKVELLTKRKKAGDISDALGISKSAFYRKLKGETAFTQVEIVKIREILGITNERMIEIFFNEEVS